MKLKLMIVMISLTQTTLPLVSEIRGVVDSRDIHKLPYETPLDSLMASYSIEHKCYGVHLDGIYTLLQQIEQTTQSQQSIFPPFAARNADTLARREQ